MRPSRRVARATLRESREPCGGTTEYTSARVPRCMVLYEHTHTPQAVMTILPPRFSCTALLSAPLLSGVAGGKSDYVQRLERCSRTTQGKKKKNPFIRQNLCRVRCITNRPEDQNVPVMGFLISSDSPFLFPVFCDIVPKPPLS